MPSSDYILQKITSLLDNHHARYKIMSHHELGFTSDEVAKIRGVELGQCSKAVILKVKGNGVKKMYWRYCQGMKKLTEKNWPVILVLKKYPLPLPSRYKN